MLGLATGMTTCVTYVTKNARTIHKQLEEVGIGKPVAILLLLMYLSTYGSMMI